MDPTGTVVERRVEWMDVDASGNIHITALVRFVEAAETVLLERLGIPRELHARIPRVHMSVDFVRPLKFGDLVDLHLWVAGVGTSSMRYQFEARRGNESYATGTVVVALVADPNQSPVPWPSELRTRLLRGGPQRPERLESGGT